MLADPARPRDRTKHRTTRVAHVLRAGVASLALLLTVGVAQATSRPPSPFVPTPTPRAALTQLVDDVGGGSGDVDAARFHYLRKLDNHLLDVAASRLGGGTVAMRQPQRSARTCASRPRAGSRSTCT